MSVQRSDMAAELSAVALRTTAPPPLALMFFGTTSFTAEREELLLLEGVVSEEGLKAVARGKSLLLFSS